MYILSYVIPLIFISIVLAVTDEGSTCITPNGEDATCVTITTCKVILDDLKYLDKDSFEFAKISQCGFNGKYPMVCCGSAGRHNTTTESPTRRTTAAPLLDIFGEPIRPTTPYVPTSPKPIDNIHLPDNTLCGIQTKQNRTVGGSVTDIDEFPWMVALKYTANDGSDGGYRCGGTLVNERYVLTAAECLSVLGYELTEVRLGEWNISTDKDCTTYEKNEEVCANDVLDIKIDYKIAHPFYSKRSGNNNIALLRLEHKVNYTDYVRPICLPASDLPPPDAGTRMDIAGWGISENGTKSDVKLKVQVPIVSNEDCSKVHTNFTHVNPNQACAGGEPGTDACKGDLGGPLMTKYPKVDQTEEEQWYQEGIIYKGLGCGRKSVPVLYTRVSRYTTWILSNLK